MASPVAILIGAAGLATSAICGLALGQYAVSGVDPTKAAAYANYNYERYESAQVSEMPEVVPVAYTQPAEVDTTDRLY